MTAPQRHLWLNPFRKKSLDERVVQAWQETPLLRGVSARICEKLVACTHVRQYNSGEHLFREGDTAVAAALIVEGSIIIRANGEDIARLEAGDFFGEAALLADSPRSASAVAEGPTSVSLLVRYQFEEFVRHRPQEGLDIMTNLARLLLGRLQLGNTRLGEDQ